MPLTRPNRRDYDEESGREYRNDLREWQAGQNRPPPLVPAPPPVDNYSRSTPPPQLPPQVETPMRLPPQPMQPQARPPALSPEDMAAVLGNREDRIMNFSGLPPQVTGRPTEGPPPQPMQPLDNPYRTVLNLDPRPIGQGRPVRGDYEDEGGGSEYRADLRDWQASQNQPMQPSDDPDAMAAWQARQEADQAANTATNQYEADVAEFKDSQATELEQGVASLPGITNLSQVPSIPGGINSIPYTPSYSETERPKQPDRWDRNIYDPDDEGAKWDYKDDMKEYREDLKAWEESQTQPPPPPDTTYPPPGTDPGEPYDPPPINYYTGQPVINPYTPYSTASGATPLTRKMTPGQFGQTPGFAMGDIAPIQGSQVADFNDVFNQGISMLPMNGQGDTLTTQVFQSGFRPHRSR